MIAMPIATVLEMLRMTTVMSSFILRCAEKCLCDSALSTLNFEDKGLTQFPVTATGSRRKMKYFHLKKYEISHYDESEVKRLYPIVEYIDFTENPIRLYKYSSTSYQIIVNMLYVNHF